MPGLHTEVWLPHIQENFFPDDSFVSKCVDDSVYVNNKKVHIPNAGKPSKVVTNRSSLPTSYSQRQDQDLEYDIDELTSDPIRISNIEEVELSYSKRESILRNDRAELQRVAHLNILTRWAKGAEDGAVVIETTGEAIAPHTSSTATGKRKAITRKDILALATAFNKQDIPKEGRYLLLDSDMYLKLLGDMNEADKNDFYHLSDPAGGVMGKLYTFNIMERSSVLRVKGNQTLVLADSEDPEATERACGFAWQESCVSRALGDVKMFSSENDPLLYGDGYSLLARVGGSHRRHDKKGIALLIEATA